MSDEIFRLGPYWLAKRRDGRSDNWHITWYDPSTGTEGRKSTRTRDFEEAKSLLTEHYLTSTRKVKEPTDQALAALVLGTYLEDHAAGSQSEERALISIQHFISFVEQEQAAGRIVGAAKVADITPRLIRRYIAWRKGPHSYRYEGASGEEVTFESPGVAGNTISRDLSDIRSAFNKAVKDGDLAAAPVIPDVAKKDKSPPRDRVLTPQEFARLLDNASDHLFLYLLLAFCTAGRPGAILELGPKNVDWTNDLISLVQPGKVQTRKRRAVLPIGKALKPWLIGCTADTFVNFVPPHRSPDPVKHRESGIKPRSVLSIKTAFRAARSRAGLGKEVIPYTIRHTVATELRKRGVPQWEVAAFLGHAAMSTTDAYAKYDPSYLQKAVNAIDDYFEELKAHTQRHVRNLEGVVEIKKKRS